MRFTGSQIQLSQHPRSVRLWPDDYPDHLLEGGRRRYLGYLNAYPDHWTQGDDLANLKEGLKDLFQTFSTEDISGIRKEEELEVA